MKKKTKTLLNGYFSVMVSSKPNFTFVSPVKTVFSGEDFEYAKPEGSSFEENSMEVSLD